MTLCSCGLKLSRPNGTLSVPVQPACFQWIGSKHAGIPGSVLRFSVISPRPRSLWFWMFPSRPRQPSLTVFSLPASTEKFVATGFVWNSATWVMSRGVLAFSAELFGHGLRQEVVMCSAKILLKSLPSCFSRSLSDRSSSDTACCLYWFCTRHCNNHPY